MLSLSHRESKIILGHYELDLDEAYELAIGILDLVGSLTNKGGKTNSKSNLSTPMPLGNKGGLELGKAPPPIDSKPLLY